MSKKRLIRSELILFFFAKENMRMERIGWTSERLRWGWFELEDESSSTQRELV